jgi:hypothetical protein
MVILALEADRVWVYRNDSSPGTCSFVTPATVLLAGDGPVSLALSDLNTDGRLDLVAGNFYGQTISLFENQSTRGGVIAFASRVDSAANAGNPNDLVAVDLDGSAVLQWPAAATRADGLRVGCGTTQGLQAKGSFEDLRTYNYSLTPDTDYDGRSDAQELAEGTNPLDAASATPVRLGFWGFNDANWTGDQGQLPKVTPVGVQRAPSFRTNALQVKNSAGAANLKYCDVEANGSANINCQKGTVRFWFKPAWNSGSRGGTTPGRLLEMGSSSGTTGWWTLEVNNAGDQVAFKTRNDGSGTVNTLLTNNLTPGEWPSNQWRQIALTYSPTASALYVDGAPLTPSGGGVSNYPNATTRGAYGFSIGSNQAGDEQAKGQFEELETFNYALSAGDISTNYAAVTASAAPFAIGVYGDLQFLAATEAPHYGSQARYNLAIDTLRNWISTEENLKVALCVGDVVHLCHLGTEAQEWTIASTAWKRLQDQCLVVIAPGNHDREDCVYGIGDPSYPVFNSNFGWLLSQSELCEHVESYTPNKVQNACWRKTISGLPFLFMTLEYGPPALVVDWAKERMQSYPDHLVVLVTHWYLDSNWNYAGPPPFIGPHRSPVGQYLWDNLVNSNNVLMVISGHSPAFPGFAWRQERNAYGRMVNEFHLDFQNCDESCACDPNCVNPWYTDGRTSAVAQLMRFDPLGNSVTVRYRACEPEPGFWLPATFTTEWVGLTLPAPEEVGEFQFSLFE